MKYLFEAIERRCGNNANSISSSSGRVILSAVELKKLVLEASEGVDDKSSAHDFVDTLERIVNEIKNTTEHSAAFLQKVRKTDVPDYYDIIKHPMDLATLQKRVKQQMYRTKKAFADDLDLIWSNCLLYNSHPGHPLRRSAEILRAKSNQLLEFISDPALPTRSLYAQSVAAQVGSGRPRGSTRGTPAPGDEADGEGDNDSEVGARARSVSVALGRHSSILQAASERLLNGVNSDSRDRSASPMGSGTQTPLASALVSRKLGRGPLGRSPSPTPEPEVPFEERPALIRTPQSMLDFASLDDELSRFESELECNAVASTSSLKLSDEPTRSSRSSKLSISSDASTDHSDSQALFYKLVHSLNPAAYPSPPPSVAPTSGDSSSSGVNGEPPTPPSAPPTVSSRPNLDEPPDALWWETVAPCAKTATASPDEVSSSTSSLKALAAGIPTCPWKAVAGDEAIDGPALNKRKGSAKGKGKGKGKSRGLVNGSYKEEKAKAVGKVRSKKAKREGVALAGLGRKMRRNTETLRRIRRLHNHLSSGTRTPPMPDPHPDANISIPLDTEHSDSDTEDARRPRASAYLDSGVPASAFRTRSAPEAARQSVEFVSTRVLEHTGFDGASSMALGVMSHIASEYLLNLGRTMRFFADRFGAKMSTEQLLLHVLSENGVGSPNDLQTYVSEEIDQYGSKLDELHGKLEEARREQVAAIETETTVVESDVFLPDDELAIDTLSSTTGEDFFGLASLGLEKELNGLASFSIPSRLVRGERSLADDSAFVGLGYPAPPPLPASAISALPGVLHPYFALRAATQDLGLQEDYARSSPGLSSFLPRTKVSALTGKISSKGASAHKRKLDDLVLLEGMPAPTISITASSIDVPADMDVDSSPMMKKLKKMEAGSDSQ